MLLLSVGATPAWGCLSLAPHLCCYELLGQALGSESVTPGPGPEEAATSICAWVCPSMPGSAHP